MGLVEKQKLQRQAAIIDAARKLIVENGYTKTSMERIAEEAEVGVATLYKYFGTKDALIKELAYPELKKTLVSAKEVLADLPSGAIQATQKLLRCYMVHTDSWEDKKLLRLFAVPFSPEYRTAFDEVVLYGDSMVKGQLNELVTRLQGRGDLPEAIDAQHISDIIFAIFNQEFISCVMSDTADPADSFKKIDRSVEVLFRLAGASPSV